MSPRRPFSSHCRSKWSKNALCLHTVTVILALFLSPVFFASQVLSKEPHLALKNHKGVQLGKQKVKRNSNSNEKNERRAADPEDATTTNTVASKSKVINGKKYTFRKLLDKSGHLRTQVSGSKREIIEESIVPNGQRQLLGKRLRDKLEVIPVWKKDAEKLRVNIALNLDDVIPDSVAEKGGMEVVDDQITRILADDDEISEIQLKEKMEKKNQNNKKAHKARHMKRKARLKNWARRHNMERRKSIEAALNQGKETLTLDMTKQEIEDLLQSNDPTIEGVEIDPRPAPMIAQAMADTGVDVWAHPYSNSRGNGIGIYMTEDGCPCELSIHELSSALWQ